MQASKDAFERLLNVMNDLREKCPWDKKQTIHSLRNLTIEETYELSDAILNNDWNGIKEELGDLFLHLVFYSKIASEQNQFEVEEVLHALCEKLIHRHPHIYGNVEVETEEEVLKNWEKLKLKEGKKSILQGVPQSLPPINKAYRMQQKTAKVGFEWENQEQVWDKVLEEINELKEMSDRWKYNNSKTDKNEIHQQVKDEFGDVLFSLINYARFIDVDPEEALERTNRKFKKRFEYIEQKAKEVSKSIDEMSLEEMDVIWEEAKNIG